MKKIVLIIIVIVLAIMVFGNLDTKNSNIIEDERTYSNSWREPHGTEFAKIGRIIVANGIKVCGEYYVKEVASGEYVIACTPDGNNWTYYVAWIHTEKILLANDEMERKLTPPR